MVVNFLESEEIYKSKQKLTLPTPSSKQLIKV